MSTGLILGGTGESRQLADRLAKAGYTSFVLSYAGVTRRAERDVAYDIRSGGFGGYAGLKAWCLDNDIRWIINATHPFAEKISHTAHTVAQDLSLPCLRLRRPDWQKADGDIWHDYSSMADIAQHLTKVPGRILITSGLTDLQTLSICEPSRLLVRALSRPDPDPLPKVTWLLQPPGVDADAEYALMQHWQISGMVTKASGGTATYGKIEAARRLALPVWRLARPVEPAEVVAQNVDEAVGWLIRGGVISRSLIHAPTDSFRESS